MTQQEARVRNVSDFRRCFWSDIPELELADLLSASSVRPSLTASVRAASRASSHLLRNICQRNAHPRLAEDEVLRALLFVPLHDFRYEKA